MFYVYILHSTVKDFYYIGSTQNLEVRLNEHSNDKNKSTRGKGPFIVVYKEEFETRSEAYKRELKIKSYKGGNALKKLIKL